MFWARLFSSTNVSGHTILHQLLLRDQAPVPFHEREQRLDRLWREGDRLVLLEEDLLDGVEPERSERVGSGA